MIYAITPQESAAMSRDKLLKAMKALAEAQQAVVQAIETLDMFENNFRQGHYKRDDRKFPPDVIGGMVEDKSGDNTLYSDVGEILNNPKGKFPYRPDVVGEIRTLPY